MTRRAPNHGIPCGLTIMYMQTMDNYICHKLHRDTSPIRNVHINSSSIYGLEAVHDQFLFECDNHVPFEDDPEWPVLDDSMAEGAWSGIYGIVVTRIRDDIVTPVAAANSIASKANGTVRQSLAVAFPVRIAPPAVINRVAGPTREVS